MMRNATFGLAALSLLLTSGLTMSRTAQAQRVPLTVNAELGANYVAGHWELTANDNFNGVIYEPDEVVLTVAREALTTRPVGTQWDFLGVAAGARIWVLPQFQVANLLYLAVSAEETPDGTFDSYDVTTESGGRLHGVAPWVRYSLIDVDGPGRFSVWQTNAFGTPVVWMATSNGIHSDDALWVPEGSDTHLNWGFTRPGRYDVTFRASGYICGVPVHSRRVTYRFRVKSV